jgi:hypothetical protein
MSRAAARGEKAIDAKCERRDVLTASFFAAHVVVVVVVVFREDT